MLNFTISLPGPLRTRENPHRRSRLIVWVAQRCLDVRTAVSRIPRVLQLSQNCHVIIILLPYVKEVVTQHKILKRTILSN